MNILKYIKQEQKRLDNSRYKTKNHWLWYVLYGEQLALEKIERMLDKGEIKWTSK